MSSFLKDPVSTITNAVNSAVAKDDVHDFGFGPCHRHLNWSSIANAVQWECVLTHEETGVNHTAVGNTRDESAEECAKHLKPKVELWYQHRAQGAQAQQPASASGTSSGAPTATSSAAATGSVQSAPGTHTAPLSSSAASRFQFRPCIDIRRGQVTQVVGSSLKDGQSAAGETEVTNFVSQHGGSYYAELYKKHNLQGGHIILLGGSSNEERAKNEAVAFDALQAWPNAMQLGGGVTSQNAQRYLDAGASHVIVTSYVFHDGQIDKQRLDQLVASVGADRIVLDLSCRKGDGQHGRQPDTYYVVTNLWQQYTNYAVTPATLHELAQYCSEFLIHGVDVEGKKQGIEVDLVTLLGQANVSLPITYAGGIRGVDDMELVRKLGSGRVHVSIGSALNIFGGNLKLDDLLQYMQQYR